MGLRSQDVTVQVPSALAGLNDGFEKEPGGPPPRNTPINSSVSSSPRGSSLRTRGANKHEGTVRSDLRPDRRHKARGFHANDEDSATKGWKSPRPLVRLGCTPHDACTCRLSNGWSTRGLTCFRSEGPHLGVGFLLRCFQQLSRPEVATEQCRWHDNSHTSAPSSPVLSY